MNHTQTASALLRRSNRLHSGRLLTVMGQQHYLKPDSGHSCALRGRSTLHRRCRECVEATGYSGCFTVVCSDFWEYSGTWWALLLIQKYTVPERLATRSCLHFLLQYCHVRLTLDLRQLDLGKPLSHPLSLREFCWFNSSPAKLVQDCRACPQTKVTHEQADKWIECDLKTKTMSRNK